ncbi:YidB family protein [Rubrivivax sp. RP6-9]|uniref:YidB family protein n=1 Tax=Rubrivivax sp. RP6-9 TaxID=3415750 RepID=UPI003CC5C747
MGLLDSVAGALGAAGGGQGGGQAALLQAVIGLIGQNGGNLGDLVAKFQQGGLGDVVGSWISTGRNLPISPEQLSGVLGNDTIAQLAQQFGMNGGDMAGQLSQLLPQVVDQLTPGGQLPSGGGALGGALGGDLGQLGDIGGLLGSLMKR